MPISARISERERHFLDPTSVDGLEVVPHGDDVIAGLAPLDGEFEGLFAVRVIPVLIIGNEHKGGGFVLVVHALLGALAAGLEFHVHPDYPVGLDSQGEKLRYVRIRIVLVAGDKDKGKEKKKEESFHERQNAWARESARHGYGPYLR